MRSAILIAAITAALILPSKAAAHHDVIFQKVAPVIERTWHPDKWKRGQPGAGAIKHYRIALRHARSSKHRAIIRRKWRRAKRAYYRHREHQRYCRSGMVIEGRVSWFTDGITASGLSAGANAGLALNIAAGTDSGWNNSTTQGWISAARSGAPVDFHVWIAGRYARMPVIDLGPAGWVYRAIDVSGPGVDLLGLSRSSFPTDSWGKVKLIPPGC
jgi:hypothetical protein